MGSSHDGLTQASAAESEDLLLTEIAGAGLELDGIVGGNQNARWWRIGDRVQFGQRINAI
jgi:hypothetical protein